MKKILLGLFFSSLFHSAFAQTDLIDSLQRALVAAKEDTVKIILFNKISLEHKNLDSSFLYAMKAKALLGKYNMPDLRMYNFSAFGLCFERSGNYPKAMENLLAGLQLAEKKKGKAYEVMFYLRMGNILAIQQDDKAVAYLVKAKNLFENFASLGTDVNNVWRYYMVGDAFQKMGRLDSALKYMQKSYELAIAWQESRRFPQILLSLGDIHYKLKNYGLALEYYKMAADSSIRQKNIWRLSLALTGKAMVYQQKGLKDSALVNARESLHLSKVDSNPENILDVSLLLATIYDLKNNKDSAYYYFKLAAVTKDSLFNKEKAQQLQNLVLNEQQRQQELETLKAKAIEERRSNLQMTGIALFILTFFALVLLLSRQKVKPRMIEFLGLISVLLLFEFIALFIHPFIVELTHHSPVFMMMILVAIAAVLVPLHHKATDWVIRRLVKKSEKIQQIKQPV